MTALGLFSYGVMPVGLRVISRATQTDLVIDVLCVPIAFAARCLGPVPVGFCPLLLGSLDLFLIWMHNTPSSQSVDL